MSGAQAKDVGFDELVTQLEKTIAQLADGSAPLNELVAAHGRAVRLLADAQSRLAGLEVRAAELAKQLE